MFLSEKNESLKTTIISYSSEGEDEESIRLKIDNEYGEIIREINENSNIQIITKNKTDENILVLLDELIHDHKEQSNLKKIDISKLSDENVLNYKLYEFGVRRNIDLANFPTYFLRINQQPEL